MSEPRTRFRVEPRDAGKRLDRFLGERIGGLSRTRIQEAIRDRVTLSWGTRARPSVAVRPGGEVTIAHVPVAEEIRDVAIPVLARGVGWLAVDKPAGIPVHPVNRVRENTIIRMLRRQEGTETLRLCHRLDRETTGVLLVAADPVTARAIATAFVGGGIAKEYLALVEGAPSAERGEIDLALGPARGSRVFVRRAEDPAGEPAFTAWRVERRLPGRTLLRVFPRTGRRHQIRVHLAAIGHAIVGDILYGRPDQDYLDLVAGVRDARAGEGRAARQMLHCARLDFPSPEGGAVAVEAPIPRDMAVAIAERP